MMEVEGESVAVVVALAVACYMKKERERAKNYLKLLPYNNNTTNLLDLRYDFFYFFKSPF